MKIYPFRKNREIFLEILRKIVSGFLFRTKISNLQNCSSQETISKKEESCHFEQKKCWIWGGFFWRNPSILIIIGGSLLLSR